MYCARTYEKILDRKLLYAMEQVKIPRPLFFVLYNGKQDYPDMVTMKLSEAFEDAVALFGADIIPELQWNNPLELTLTVININKGRNSKLISRSEILSGYVEFIDRVTQYINAGLSRSEAITKAVRECIADGILVEYLTKHGSEVSNMVASRMGYANRSGSPGGRSIQKRKSRDRGKI